MIRNRFKRKTMANITLSTGQVSNQDANGGTYVGRIVAVRKASFLFSVPPKDA